MSIRKASPGSDPTVDQNAFTEGNTGYFCIPSNNKKAYAGSTPSSANSSGGSSIGSGGAPGPTKASTPSGTSPAPPAGTTGGSATTTSAKPTGGATGGPQVSGLMTVGIVGLVSMVAVFGFVM